MPRVGRIQWVGALVINCVHGMHKTVGRTIPRVGGCTGSGKIQSNTDLPNTAVAMYTFSFTFRENVTFLHILIFTLPCH